MTSRFQMRVAAALWGLVACAGSVVAQETRPDRPKPRQVEIAITEDGFSPGRVEVEAGVPIELVFLRNTDKTCATEVAVPSLKLKKPLPLNEPGKHTLTLIGIGGSISYADGTRASSLRADVLGLRLPSSIRRHAARFVDR